MKPVVRKLVLSGLVLIASMFAACSSGSVSDHDQTLGGVGHRDGYADPLNNCVECHGDTLQGGTAPTPQFANGPARHVGVGPSCYSCHNSNDHLTIRKGVRHNQPGIDCARCHGPTLGGGLGPACVQNGCHAA